MKVVYFVAESGRRPAEEFVKGLNVHSREKFFLSLNCSRNLGKGCPFRMQNILVMRYLN